MATSLVTQRLAELLLEPRETLEVEAKCWIDIVNDGDHKALLAKAIIALANHGGGVIIIGFEKSANGLVPAQGRPTNLAGYTSDTVNAVVNRYAEPNFHCDVQIVTAPGSTDVFPIIVVPGGHKVPIKAKRSGPNGQVIQQHSCYVRRPGPQSESPQTAQEWDSFFARCLSNRRDELLDTLRLILEGGASTAPVETDIDRVTNWLEDSKARWKELAERLPDGHPARLEHGYYAVGFEAAGDFEPRSGGGCLKRCGLAWSGTRAGHLFGCLRAKASNRASTGATWSVGSAPTQSFSSLLTATSGAPRRRDSSSSFEDTRRTARLRVVAQASCSTSRYRLGGLARSFYTRPAWLGSLGRPKRKSQSSQSGRA